MMKTFLQQHNKWVRGAAVAATVLGPVALADTWTPFNPKAGDILVGFRLSGKPDLVVDLGPYTGLTTTMTIPSSYLTSVFGGSLNNVTWSAFGSINDTSAGSLYKTLFATDPSGTPWVDQTAALQASSNTKIYTFGTGLNTAVNNSLQSVNVLAANTLSLAPNGTSTDKSYTYLMTHTGTGNFMNTFQGGSSVEATFAGVDQTMPFYQMVPDPSGSNPPATLLGTFDFSPSGTLTYTPVPESASFALVGGLGLLGFAGVRRLARKI
jgi:hypothetical protein